MIRRPPRSTLFPYPTLFRSDVTRPVVVAADVRPPLPDDEPAHIVRIAGPDRRQEGAAVEQGEPVAVEAQHVGLLGAGVDRKSTRLNSSHDQISYARICLKVT